MEDLLKDLPTQSLDLTTSRGGFTCCVPGCFRNSRKDQSLSFYRIPKDKTLRRPGYVKSPERTLGQLTDIGYLLIILLEARKPI